MKHIATLISPLKIIFPRKKVKDKSFILNLNNYRNAHPIILNDSKRKYKEAMQQQIETLPVLNKIAVRFTLYPKSHRRTDTPNVCSIHDKYFMDALVEFGKLKDDTYEYYVETGYRFGYIDKENPRVEIEIYQYK